MSKQFTGKTVLITGATGGIGQQIVRDFSLAGADVLLHTHKNTETAETLLNEIHRNGANGKMFQCDFSETNAAVQLLKQIDKAAAQIDIFVNAAGLDLMTPDIAAMPFGKKIQLLFQTDVFVPIQLSKIVGKRMKDTGGGTIFFFSWNGVRYGWNTETAQLYGAAKGAVAGFSRSLAEGLPPEVRIRTLHLGWIATRWGARTSDEFKRLGSCDSLQNRWGTPQDVSQTVLFLSSDASSFIDGTAVYLDGTKRGTR
ncbi:MAG: SDR family oxidoreductase [Planctomycetaceae bacterium]|jgi:NAD(P)-dependent dehydrogenase (short-subunit alcohol dehydrogenase family)|nr:SDR family oxidoreductase [Planctomycetaceae bacterium]